jgi:hypothetical protein
MQPINRLTDTSSTSISLWDRLTLACGIGFTVCLFGAQSLAPEPPALTAPAAEVSAFLGAHRDVILAQDYLRGITAFLMLLFVGGGVVGAIRRAQGGASASARLALGGAVIFSLIMFLSNVVGGAGAILAAQGADPEIARALNTLGETMRHFNAFSGALMIGAASVGLLGARAVNRAVGIFGLVVALVFVVGAVGFPTTQLEVINYAAFPFVPIWPVVVSIALLVRSRSPRGVAQAQAVAA